ncbi:class I SAM-dependent methyltransferase [Methylobacterium sp. C25]|uniref:class I SAM-dependent methyltransferase n=1 Tax=Methylobacterium sp. C25 TaxID=2721622 RepID=UPI001F1789BD|nr:class I SAM-dependent methyltransferase [Methylobacterium sp. C25]MCE4226499.1 class I SAM-dependent methyltransferase [Methylobacterium sp. C25]
MQTYEIPSDFASLAASADVPVRQAHWQDAYVRHGGRHVSWFQEAPQPSLDLVTHFAGSPDAAIVDVGGGAACLVDHLLDRGFANVTVLDLSAASLAAAKARLGSSAAAVHWLVDDAVRWVPPQAYVVWHDRAAFHFLTEEADRAAYLARLTQALTPGAHAVIGTFAPDGPERCSGLPVVRYDADTLARTLGAPFVRVRTQRHEHTTPSGAIQAFQFSVFRRVA